MSGAARITGVVLASVFALAGCGTEPPPSEPIEVTIGPHRVAFRVPDGWLHFDHGREQLFERDLQDLSIADLGPVTARALTRDVERARELWRDGRVEDARTLLDSFDLRASDPGPDAWRTVADAWDTILVRSAKARPADVEGAYGVVLDRLEEAPTLDLAERADRALTTLGHGELRAVAARVPRIVGGEPALQVDTWDRLSHAHPARFVFLVRDGRLLVARTELGRFEDMEAPFEALIESIEFR